MFEPMGGSDPKYAGKNVINPLATVAAGGVRMDTLGETAIAKSVAEAIRDVLASGQIESLAAGCTGTREVGDLIAKMVS
jgi:3-isopropylmalate dehydrogenase